MQKIDINEKNKRTDTQNVDIHKKYKHTDTSKSRYTRKGEAN